MQGEMLLFEAESKAVRGEGSACLPRAMQKSFFSQLFSSWKEVKMEGRGKATEGNNGRSKSL